MNHYFFSKIINVDDIKINKYLWQFFSLVPEGRVSMKISWLEVTENISDFLKSDESSLLQIFIDSVRNISSKYRPYVEVTVNDQTQQTSTSSIVKEVAKYKKHFNFVVKNPELESLDVKVIDQQSTLLLGEYNYNISDLLIRKNFEHELQAFPLNSSINFEIIFALKLNLLKIPIEIQ